MVAISNVLIWPLRVTLVNTTNPITSQSDKYQSTSWEKRRLMRGLPTAANFWSSLSLEVSFCKIWLGTEKDKLNTHLQTHHIISRKYLCGHIWARGGFSTPWESLKQLSKCKCINENVMTTPFPYLVRDLNSATFSCNKACIETLPVPFPTPRFTDTELEAAIFPERQIPAFVWTIDQWKAVLIIPAKLN